MSISTLTDAEKTTVWLARVLLPKFFDIHRNELGDIRFITLLQNEINEWQRNKLRQDSVKVTVESDHLDIVVKVDSKIICTFSG